MPGCKHLRDTQIRTTPTGIVHQGPQRRAYDRARNIRPHQEMVTNNPTVKRCSVPSGAEKVNAPPVLQRIRRSAAPRPSDRAQQHANTPQRKQPAIATPISAPSIGSPSKEIDRAYGDPFPTNPSEYPKFGKHMDDLILVHETNVPVHLFAIFIERISASGMIVRQTSRLPGSFHTSIKRFCLPA